MERSVVAVVVLAVVCVGAGADNGTLADTTDGLAKMSQQCLAKYSLTCFKLDAMRLVDKLGHSPAYPLLPGISLLHADYPPASPLPQEVADGNVTALDELLAVRLTGYLNSLTLTVKLLDKGTVSGARRLGQQILAERQSTDMQTGRKKGGGAAVWAAGTMAAVGMAALAAVSGKALMTSMLALMLAAAGALRGGAGGGGDSGGHKCSSYAYPASRRSIALERPVYRPGATPTYGPASP